MSSSRLQRYVDDVFMDIDPRCYPPPLIQVPDLPIFEPIIPQYDFTVEHKAVKDYETLNAASCSLETSPVVSQSEAQNPTPSRFETPSPSLSSSSSAQFSAPSEVVVNSNAVRFVTVNPASRTSTPPAHFVATPPQVTVNSNVAHFTAVTSAPVASTSPAHFVTPAHIGASSSAAHYGTMAPTSLTSTSPARYITPSQVVANSNAGRFVVPHPMLPAATSFGLNSKATTSLPTVPIASGSARTTSLVSHPKPMFFNGILEPSRVTVTPQLQMKKETPKPVLNTFEEFEQKPNLFDLLEMRTIDDKTVLEQVLMASVTGSTSTGTEQNLTTNHARPGSLPATLSMNSPQTRDVRNGGSDSLHNNLATRKKF